MAKATAKSGVVRFGLLVLVLISPRPAPPYGGLLERQGHHHDHRGVTTSTTAVPETTTSTTEADHHDRRKPGEAAVSIRRPMSGSATPERGRAIDATRPPVRAFVVANNRGVR